MPGNKDIKINLNCCHSYCRQWLMNSSKKGIFWEEIILKYSSISSMQWISSSCRKSKGGSAMSILFLPTGNAFRDTISSSISEASEFVSKSFLLYVCSNDWGVGLTKTWMKYQLYSDLFILSLHIYGVKVPRIIAIFKIQSNLFVLIDIVDWLWMHWYRTESGISSRKPRRLFKEFGLINEGVISLLQY